MEVRTLESERAASHETFDSKSEGSPTCLAPRLHRLTLNNISLQAAGDDLFVGRAWNLVGIGHDRELRSKSLRICARDDFVTDNVSDHHMYVHTHASCMNACP